MVSRLLHMQARHRLIQSGHAAGVSVFEERRKSRSACVVLQTHIYFDLPSDIHTLAESKHIMLMQPLILHVHRRTQQKCKVHSVDLVLDCFLHLPIDFGWQNVLLRMAVGPVRARFRRAKHYCIDSWWVPAAEEVSVGASTGISG